MKVGPFTIRHGLTYEIYDGTTLMYRRDSFQEALDLADELWEEDREREEIAQFGSGRNGNIADDRWKMRREAV